MTRPTRKQRAMRQVAAEREAKRRRVAEPPAEPAEPTECESPGPTQAIIGMGRWNSGYNTGSESEAVALGDTSASEIEVSDTEDTPISEYGLL